MITKKVKLKTIKTPKFATNMSNQAKPIEEKTDPDKLILKTNIKAD